MTTPFSNSDTITVLFQDHGHQNLHRVLVAFGFSFEVISPGFLVGLVYRHPAKQLEVELTLGEGEYRAVTSNLTKQLGERINTEEHYSVLEWDWMEEAADDEAEFLRRELHILVHIRPHTMTHVPTRKGK